MDPPLAVELEVAGQRLLRFPAVGVVFQVHLLVLRAPPQPLDEHVVERAAATSKC